VGWLWVDHRPSYPDDFAACQPGQVPIYTNYSTFKDDVASHHVTQGDTVIFDNEVWKYTPAWEQEHQILYEQLAAQLAVANGITFINAPFGKSAAITIADDVGLQSLQASSRFRRRLLIGIQKSTERLSGRM